MFILKWGGILTSNGIDQAKELGNWFKINMYPDGEKGGFLRLHNT